jgi:hypothetical protein
MSKPAPQNAEPVNADSFLDIVASVVCIMLIMILMVGMRIKGMPVEAPQSAEAAQAVSDLAQARAVEESLRGDVLRAAAEAETIARDAAARSVQRDLLATTLSAMEHDLVLRGGKGQVEAEVDVDLARQVADARRQLADFRRVRVQVDATKPEPVVVESYPTPISRTVDEHEAHFQLRNGRIVYVPLEPLLKKFKADAERQLYKLRDRAELTDVVGPEGEFRLRYTLVREEVPGDGSMPGHVRIELKKWTLLPLADDIGETADEALALNSEFRKALKSLRRGRNTVTIWLYPESFDAFRKIRKELYAAGFAIAARPLPPDELIGGSPDGTKSAAQ